MFFSSGGISSSFFFSVSVLSFATKSLDKLTTFRILFGYIPVVAQQSIIFSGDIINWCLALKYLDKKKMNLH